MHRLHIMCHATEDWLRAEQVNCGSLVRTYLSVRARAPTDVAKEFPRSFAPMPATTGEEEESRRRQSIGR